MAEIIECPNCEICVVVTEHSGGFPGEKEREFGYCPKSSVETNLPHPH